VLSAQALYWPTRGRGAPVLSSCSFIFGTAQTIVVGMSDQNLQVIAHKGCTNSSWCNATVQIVIAKDLGSMFEPLIADIANLRLCAATTRSSGCLTSRSDKQGGDTSTRYHPSFSQKRPWFRQIAKQPLLQEATGYLLWP
jgi:hypothetical protein